MGSSPSQIFREVSTKRESVKTSDDPTIEVSHKASNTKVLPAGLTRLDIQAHSVGLSQGEVAQGLREQQQHSGPQEWPCLDSTQPSLLP